MELYTNGQWYTVEDVAKEFGVDDLDRLRAADADGRRILDRDEWTWRVAELPVAYNPLTRTVRRAADRFDKKTGELLGICDLVMERADGNLVVRDWKTGTIKYENAADVAQTRVCGLMAAKLFGFERVTVELTYITPSGPGAENIGELDELELDSVDAWTAILIRDLPNRTTMQVGKWCSDSYCPISTVCPALKEKKRRKVA